LSQTAGLSINPELVEGLISRFDASSDGHILKKQRNNQGSLLIEALLAVVILSASLTLIVRSQASSLRALVYSADYSLALFLAEDKLYELIQQGFLGQSLVIHEEGAFLEPNDRYRYVVDASQKSEDSQIFRELTLQVSWPAGSRDRSLSLRTYFFDLPSSTDATSVIE
jgi:hypothetical protein